MKIIERLKDLRYIKVRGKDYDLVEELRIDEDDLQTAFLEHTERVIFWNRIKAREHSVLRRMQEEMQELIDERFIQYRQLYESENRDFTDSLIRSEVGIDEKVIEKRKETRRAKSKVDALFAVCDAFEHRKTVLMHLGATYRRENENLISKKGN